MFQLVSVLSFIGLARCVLGELKRPFLQELCIWTDGTSVTIRSGYARVKHGNHSSRSSSVEGVNTR